jgi:hypothetical protein
MNERLRELTFIADFTGKNPNVYFEAGLADAWRKKWIVLAQSATDLAFDVQHIRAIIYSNKMGGDENLKEHLRRAIEETMGLGRLTELSTGLERGVLRLCRSFGAKLLNELLTRTLD